MRRIRGIGDFLLDGRVSPPPDADAPRHRETPVLQTGITSAPSSAELLDLTTGLSSPLHLGLPVTPSETTNHDTATVRPGTQSSTAGRGPTAHSAVGPTVHRKTDLRFTLRYCAARVTLRVRPLATARDRPSVQVSKIFSWPSRSAGSVRSARFNVHAAGLNAPNLSNPVPTRRQLEGPHATSPSNVPIGLAKVPPAGQGHTRPGPADAR